MKKLITLMLAAIPVAALADGADFVEKAMPGIATAIVFSSVIAIVAIVYYSAHRARSLRHATIRYALEKGVAPPAELLEESRNAVDDARDLRRGLTLLGLGVGVMLTFYWLPTDTAHEAPWSLGFIPALVGAGYLVTWFVRGRPLGVRA
ncbi:MAG: DUF6249 domain-containing protein [Anaeromyxobacter sp.]